MDFLTQVQIDQLLHNGKPGIRDRDNPPVVRLFVPFTRCVWLLSEMEEIDNEETGEKFFIAFGLCDMGMGFPELGYVGINELNGIKEFHPLKLGVESDPDFESKYPMSVYADAASRYRSITTSEDKLLASAQHKQSRPPGFNPSF